MTDIEHLNHALFFWINNALKSPLGDVLLGYTTHLGNGAIVFPVALLWLYIADRNTFVKNAVALALTGLICGALLTGAKAFFNAPRPLAVFQDAIQQGAVVVHVMFEPLYEKSFPSGHSQTAFTVAHALIVLISKSRQLSVFVKLGVYGLAALTSLSRVYVGAHFPLDVVAGAALGVASAHTMLLSIEAVTRYIAARKSVQPETRAAGTPDVKN